MVISAPKTNEVLAVNISCSSESLTAELADGRVSARRYLGTRGWFTLPKMRETIGNSKATAMRSVGQIWTKTYSSKRF